MEQGKGDGARLGSAQVLLFPVPSPEQCPGLSPPRPAAAAQCVLRREAFITAFQCNHFLINSSDGFISWSSFPKSLILFLCKINIFRSPAWKKHPRPRGGGEEEAEPAQLLAPKGFCCRLCFPKQPSSSSDHLQGGKNKNKTKRGSRSLKGSIWMLLRMGDGSGTWPCLASAVPIAAGDRQTEYFYI